MLEGIDQTLHEKVPTKDLTDDHSSQHPKALVMVWDSHADAMSISLGTTEEFTPTKYRVISDIVQTFDILGWLAHTLILMKIMFQRLCSKKSFSRCNCTRVTTQLHGFSDASENAYAAVVRCTPTAHPQCLW